MTIVEEIDKASQRPNRSANIVDALKYWWGLPETPQNIGEAVKMCATMFASGSTTILEDGSTAAGEVILGEGSTAVPSYPSESAEGPTLGPLAPPKQKYTNSTIVGAVDNASQRPHRSKNIVDALKYWWMLDKTPQNIGEAIKMCAKQGGFSEPVGSDADPDSPPKQ